MTDQADELTNTPDPYHGQPINIGNTRITVNAFPANQYRPTAYGQLSMTPQRVEGVMVHLYPVTLEDAARFRDEFAALVNVLEGWQR